MNTITVQLRDQLIDGDDGYEYPTLACARCEKGYVTISVLHKLVFPTGSLISAGYGEQVFYLFTCDRCLFLFMTNDILYLVKRSVKQGSDDMEGEIDLFELIDHEQGVQSI